MSSIEIGIKRTQGDIRGLYEAVTSTEASQITATVGMALVTAGVAFEAAHIYV